MQELPAALDSFNDICIENQRRQQQQQQTVHNSEKIRQIVDQAKASPVACAWLALRGLPSTYVRHSNIWHK